jgi:hypothetical protein
MISTILPLINLIRALFLSRTTVSDDALLKAGMLRIDLLDERNVIPLAFLTVAMIAVATALIQSPVLRATLEYPLPLAPGRLVAAISTSIGITLLCQICCIHIGMWLVRPRL